MVVIVFWVFWSYREVHWTFPKFFLALSVPGALYFVATGAGDGSHRFSATLEEHNEAVRDYLRQIRQNRKNP